MEIREEKKSREGFEAYLSSLFLWELELVRDWKKWNREERSLMECIWEERSRGREFSGGGEDRRVKSRFKKRIQACLSRLDLDKKEEEMETVLAEEIRFSNIKKFRRAIFIPESEIMKLKSPLVLSSLLDKYFEFFLRHFDPKEIKRIKRQKQILAPFEQLYQKEAFFLMEIRHLQPGQSLDWAKVDALLATPTLTDGARYVLWEAKIAQANQERRFSSGFESALGLLEQMRMGRMYSRFNMTVVIGFLNTLSKQLLMDFSPYEREMAREKGKKEVFRKLSALISHLLRQNEGPALPLLRGLEREIGKGGSEEYGVMFRLAKSEYFLMMKDPVQARKQNDFLWASRKDPNISAHLDKVIDHRFRVMAQEGDWEGIEGFFQKKWTQRYLVQLERAGRPVIFPKILFWVAKSKSEPGPQTEWVSLIFSLAKRHLENGYFNVFRMLRDSLAVVGEELEGLSSAQKGTLLELEAEVRKRCEEAK